MPLERGAEHGGRRLESERDPVGELEVERLALRLDRMHHLAHEPLGDEIRRQLAGDDDHRERALGGGPALLCRRADEHVVPFDRGRATALGDVFCP